MSRLRGVHHLAIQVRDLARVAPFYTGVLGLSVIKRWPESQGNGERSIWLDSGDGAFLALEVVAERATAAETAAAAAAEDERRADRPGLHLLALRIDAAERAAWQERLAAAGVAICHQTPFTLYVKDPEGNRIGLSSYPDAGGGAG